MHGYRHNGAWLLSCATIVLAVSSASPAKTSAAVVEPQDSPNLVIDAVSAPVDDTRYEGNQAYNANVEGETKHIGEKEKVNQIDLEEKAEVQHAPNFREFMSWGTVTEVNGRQIDVYVITLEVKGTGQLLQSNTSPKEAARGERMELFRQEWEGAWPGIHVSVIEGVRDDRRGYGCTKAYLQQLQQAMYDKCDICIFMEDDAAPFLDASYPGELMTAVEAFEAKDGAILLLGGHNVEKDDSEGEAKRPITRIKHSFGSYGFMVHRDRLAELRDFWTNDLARAESEGAQDYSPDRKWFEKFADKGIYLATPLLVDHRNGYSENWDVQRTDSWNGERNIELKAAVTQLSNQYATKPDEGTPVPLANTLKPAWVGKREWWAV